jgi:subtilisin family serine protease
MELAAKSPPTHADGATASAITGVATAGAITTTNAKALTESLPALESWPPRARGTIPLFNITAMSITFKDALQLGTGAGVKIGILDTGIVDLPNLQRQIAGHFYIEEENHRLRIFKSQTGFDDLSHGTVCADIIHRHAPDALLFDVKVMDANALNSRFKLEAGIRLGIEQGWHILTLSVGTQVEDPQLKRATEEALARGIIILSAIECGAAKPGFPAAYPGVISIDYDSFKHPLAVKPGDGKTADLIGHGVYVEALNSGGKMENHTGSSFACPHVTALAARARQFFPEMTSKEFLSKIKSWDGVA